MMMICPSSCFSSDICLRISLTLSEQGFFAAAAFGHGFFAQQGFLQWGGHVFLVQHGFLQ
jgi:hypothetical protein